MSSEPRREWSVEFRQSFVHESSCAALVAVVSRVMSLDVVLCVHCRVAMFRVWCARSMGVCY